MYVLDVVSLGLHSCQLFEHGNLGIVYLTPSGKLHGSSCFLITKWGKQFTQDPYYVWKQTKLGVLSRFLLENKRLNIGCKMATMLALKKNNQKNTFNFLIYCKIFSKFTDFFSKKRLLIPSFFRSKSFLLI